MLMAMLLTVIQKQNYKQFVNNFAMAYHCFDLTVSIKKTKVLEQPSPNTILPDFDITICGTPLEQVEHFPYLDSLFHLRK